MSPEIVDSLSVIFFRIAWLATGAFMFYLGYRLFTLGVFERAGDIKASWGENHLIVKQAAPGTVLAIAGAIVIGIGAFKQVEITRGTNLPKEVISVIAKVVGQEDLDQEDRTILIAWLSEAGKGSRTIASATGINPIMIPYGLLAENLSPDFMVELDRMVAHELAQADGKDEGGV